MSIRANNVIADVLLTAPSLELSSLPTSSETTKAATVEYVNNLVEGLSAKNTVVAATVGPLGFDNATTQTITGSVSPTSLTDFQNAFGGVVLVEDDRVLVKDQGSNNYNGIYEVTTLPVDNTQGFLLTRTLDANSEEELRRAYVLVEKGEHAKQGWVATGTATLSSMTWSQWSAGDIDYDADYPWTGLHTFQGGLTSEGSGQTTSITTDTVNISAAAGSSVSLGDTTVPELGVTKLALNPGGASLVDGEVHTINNEIGFTLYTRNTVTLNTTADVLSFPNMNTTSAYNGSYHFLVSITSGTLRKTYEIVRHVFWNSTFGRLDLSDQIRHEMTSGTDDPVLAVEFIKENSGASTSEMVLRVTARATENAVVRARVEFVSF